MSKFQINGVLACLMAVLCGYALTIKQLTVDSWTLFELSRTIFSSREFYRVEVVRQYVDAAEYSRAIPPLYPLLIRLVDMVTDLGIVSGILINIGSCVAIYVLLRRLLSEQKRQHFISLSCFFCLLSASPFIEEVQAARTIPLALALWLVLANLLLPIATLSTAKCIAGGLLLGLLTQLRFDSLPAIPFIVFGLWLAKIRVRDIGAFVGSCLVGMLPWMLYSWTHFATPWASDAGRQSLYSFFYYNMDYFLDTTHLPTLMTHPVDWLKVTWVQFLRASKSFLVMRFLFPIAAVFGFVLWKDRARRFRSYCKEIKKSDFYCVALPLVAHTLLILKTGFYQPRYFLLEMLAALIFLGIYLARFCSEKMGRIAFVLSAIALGASWWFHMISSPVNGVFASNMIRGNQLSTEESILANYLVQEPRDDRGLLVADNSIYYPRFGTLTGVQTFPMPTNSNDCVVVHLIDQRSIRFVYGQLDFNISDFFEVRPVADHLVRIVRAKDHRPDFAGICDRLPHQPTLM